MASSEVPISFIESLRLNYSGNAWESQKNFRVGDKNFSLTGRYRD